MADNQDEQQEQQELQEQEHQQEDQQDFTDNYNTDNNGSNEYNQNENSFQSENNNNNLNTVNYSNELNNSNNSNNNNNNNTNNSYNENGDNYNPEDEEDDGDRLEPEQYRKLFIGSLNYITSEETMRNYFGKFGEIVDCVIMKEPKTSKSRGFGFVTYSKSLMVDEVMKNRPHKLDGRELETKRATPREEAGKPGAELTTKKLFVGAIKEGLTEDHLKEYFGPYGTITDCVIMREKETNKSRGFGFVSFDDYDPVDKIVLEKFHTINGQSVAVKKALPKDQSTRNRGSGGGGGGGGGGHHSNNNGNFDDDNFGNNFGNFNFNNLPNNFAQMAQKMFQAVAVQNFGRGGRQMNFTADDFEGFQGFGGKSGGGGGGGGGPMRGGNKYGGRSGGPYGGGRRNNNNNNNNNNNKNN